MPKKPQGRELSSVTRINNMRSNFQEYVRKAKQLSKDNPELDELTKIQLDIVEDAKHLIEQVGLATKTINSLNGILAVCLPALNEVADANLDPHGNHYATLKGATRTAHNALIKVDKPLKSLKALQQ